MIDDPNDDTNNISLEGTPRPIEADTPTAAEQPEPQLQEDQSDVIVTAAATPEPETLGRTFNEEGRLVSSRARHQPQRRDDFDFYS